MSKQRRNLTFGSKAHSQQDGIPPQGYQNEQRPSSSARDSVPPLSVPTSKLQDYKPYMFGPPAESKPFELPEHTNILPAKPVNYNHIYKAYVANNSVVHPKSSSLRNSDLLLVSNFTELSPTLEEERRK